MSIFYEFFFDFDYMTSPEITYQWWWFQGNIHDIPDITIFLLRFLFHLSWLISCYLGSSYGQFNVSVLLFCLTWITKKLVRISQTKQRFSIKNFVIEMDKIFKLPSITNLVLLISKEKFCTWYCSEMTTVRSSIFYFEMYILEIRII